MINLKHESQKNKIIMISIVVIILAAYVYLFTSAKTVNVPLTKQSEVTKLNDDIEFSENKILSVLYSRVHENEKFLEVMIRIENKNNDGTREFEVEAENYDTEKLKIDLVNRKDNYFTYRINFDKKFKEVKIFVYPKFFEKSAESQDVSTLIFNKYNTQIGVFKILKTEDEFLKLRLNLLWEMLLKENKKYQEKIQTKEKIKQSLETEIKDNTLNKKQESILNIEEKEEKKSKLKDLKNNLVEVEKEIKKLKERSKKNEEQIYKIRKNLSQFK